MIDTVDFSKWLNTQLLGRRMSGSSGKDEKGRKIPNMHSLRLLTLWHLGDGGDRRRMLQEWPVDNTHDFNVKEHCDLICKRAKSDANALGDVQKYEVIPQFGPPDDEDAVTQAYGRYAIMIQGVSADEGDYADDLGLSGPMKSEPTNAKGILSQMMRFTESTVRANLLGVKDNYATMRQLLADALEENRELRKERREMILRDEENLNGQAERNLAIRREAKREEMQGAILGKLSMIIPVIVSKMMRSVTGSDMGVSAGVNPRVEKLKALVSTIDQAQFPAIFATLKQEQGMLLLDIMQDFAQDHEAEQEALKKKEAEIKAAGEVKTEKGTVSPSGNGIAQVPQARSAKVIEAKVEGS